MAENSRTFETSLLEGHLVVHTSGGKVPPKGQTLDIPLETLRNISNVARFEVKMIHKRFLIRKNLITSSLKAVIKSRIFIDWMLLKCEAMHINFPYKQDIEIFSLGDFKVLKQLVFESTVFPLPFIYNDPKIGTRYFYANYSSTIDNPVSKLKSRIFYDAEGVEVSVPCDGIKLESQYVGRIQKFKIYVGSNVKYFSRHLLEIKRLITCNHILFGFLQEWIKRLHLDYYRNYTMDQIATRLTLEKESVEEFKKKKNGAPRRLLPRFLVQSLPDCSLYLTFTGSITNQFSFEIENVETPIVSTSSIVQYYRQFFYINDETKSNALKCLLDCLSADEDFLQVRDVIQYKNVGTVSAPKVMIKARTVEEINRGYEIQKEAEKVPEKKAEDPEKKEEEPEKNEKEPKKNVGKPEKNVGEPEKNVEKPEKNVEKPERKEKDPEKNEKEPEKNVEEAEKNVEKPEKNVGTVSAPKVMIKARTVEEINRGYEIQKEAEKVPEKKAEEPEKKEKELEKTEKEPKKNVEEPEKNVGKPEKNVGKPEKNVEKPEKNVGPVSAPKVMIKARTVEEINRGYEIQKEAKKVPEKKAEEPEKKEKELEKTEKEPKKNVEEPEKNVEKPEKNVGEPEKNVEKPEKNVGEPERKEKDPEKNEKEPGNREKEQTNEGDLMNVFNIPKDNFRPEWLPTVRKALDECFEENPVEFLYEDEFKETSVMIQKFQEAVSLADKTGSVRIFLEHVFSTLQLSFTNSTCQTIMNCMIYEELKSRCEAENNPAQGLSELVRSSAKRKAGTNENELRLKMPTLMPLTKFLKLERLPVKPRKGILSEDRSSSHSEIQPSKAKGLWGEEKLYGECMTSKTKVILRRLEDTVGCKNFDKNVKLKKRKTSSSASDLSIPYDCFKVGEGKLKLKRRS